MSDDIFDRVFGDWGDGRGLKVQVTRKAPLEFAAYLGTIEVDDPSDIDEDALERRFGGGKYYLLIRNSRGRYAGHKHVQISGPPTEGSFPFNDYESEEMVDSIGGNGSSVFDRLSRIEQQIQAIWMFLMSK